MTNPYYPPKFQNYIAAKSMVSTINGLLIGIGIGLQTCDFIDLSPADYTPLYGWRNGLVFFGLLGTAMGYTRIDVLAWRWFIFLGFMNLAFGSTVAFTTFAESPINLYTATMISAVLLFMKPKCLRASNNDLYSAAITNSTSPRENFRRACFSIHFHMCVFLGYSSSQNTRATSEPTVTSRANGYALRKCAYSASA